MQADKIMIYIILHIYIIYLYTYIQFVLAISKYRYHPAKGCLGCELSIRLGSLETYGTIRSRTIGSWKILLWAELREIGTQPEVQGISMAK